MKTTSKNSLQATLAVGSAIAAGAREAVISPGSRNTPIVMALARYAADGHIKLHTIVDERAAGFYALGLARITGSPVVLSCTSGSAGTHYFPAIAEANKSRLSLIIITADRPAELQDCGAPQTMNQKSLFGSHVRGFRHLPAPTKHTMPSNADVSAFMHLSVQPSPGPVHLNMAFRKPLWEACGDASTTHEALNHGIEREPGSPSDAGLARLIESARSSARGVFIWGAGEVGVAGGTYVDQRRKLSHQVAALAKLLGWPILSDATAGIRDNAEGCLEHIGTADSILRSDAFAQHADPELVVRIGGEPTSKPFSAWLRDYTAGKAYILDPSGWARDPSRTAEAVITGDPGCVLDALLGALTASRGSVDEGWLALWKRADHLAKEAIATGCGIDQLWAGSVAETLSRGLPQGSLLHLASSLAIRSFVSFVPQGTPGLTVTSNRGLNGIDGTLATSLGQAARWHDGPTAVLLGDVAFLHDASALAYAPTDRPFIIVVVDNRGGGIFDHLPIAAAGEPFEQHFITDPSVDIAAVAKAYGLSARVACSTQTFREHLDSATQSPGSHLIVAKIEREDDVSRHNALWNHARELVDGGLV